jgi:hypothetical protein
MCSVWIILKPHDIDSFGLESVNSLGISEEQMDVKDTNVQC